MQSSGRRNREAHARSDQGAVRHAVAYVVAIGLFVGVALASIPLLHGLQDAAGARATRVTERAWFKDPVVVNGGVEAGANVTVAVVPSRSGPVSWSVFNGTRMTSSSSVEGNKGAAVTFAFSTHGMTSQSWASVRIGGLQTPLRLWIR